MAKLPNWLKQDPSGVMVVNPTLAYPAILALLKVPSEKLDQYWVECVYQIAKLATQEFAVRKPGKPVVIEILSDPEWALAAFPRGRGAEVATRGLEAREHYARIRDKLLAA